jgi:16S rRNA processing protein RimM
MLTGSIKRFRGLKVFLISPDDGSTADGRIAIENAWLHQGRLVLKFAGVDSISRAEELRGYEVCIPFEERAPLDEGEVYLTDLVGCAMVDASGRNLGLVEGWQELPGAPLLLEVRSPRGDSYAVPFTAAICRRVDTRMRVIEADLPEGLMELNRP